MARPVMDRDRLAVLSQAWEPGQRFTRDDINALMELIDARDERIRSLEAEVSRAREAAAKIDSLRRAASVVNGLTLELSEYLPH